MLADCTTVIITEFDPFYPLVCHYHSLTQTHTNMRTRTHTRKHAYTHTHTHTYTLNHARAHA